MKRWLLLLWLLLPLPVVVWHYGPGQRWLARDRAHGFIQAGERAEAGGNWAEAEGHYRAAADLAGPSDPALRLRLELATVRTRYRQGSAVESIDQIDRLVADPQFRAASPETQREARDLAGRIHYHAAWVMRLEGARRELWMEEAELARQNFRLLAENSPAGQSLAGGSPGGTTRPARDNPSPASPGGNDGNRVDAGSASTAGLPAATMLQHTNLESAVRLQRMSLTELMARPLPEEGQAMSGQGLSEQMARRRGQRGKGDQPGIGENEDARDPANGAGTTRFPGGPGS